MNKNLIKNFLKGFWLFPVKSKRICFICNRGNQFCCNPKYMAEYIKKKYRNTYEIIWVYSSDKIKHHAEELGYKTVKTNSLSYTITLMTSRYIVTNITVPLWIPYRKKQVKMTTWHGSFFKGWSATDKYDYNVLDYFVTENELSSRVCRQPNTFNYKNAILKTGMPRNDVLLNMTAEHKNQIRKKVGLPAEKKVFLYAPTFRDTGTADCFSVDFDKLLESIQSNFGGDWILAFRYHPLQKKRRYSDGCIDCSNYQDMQELLSVTDILMTDYSSCMWDFSLMKRPCFIYATDIDNYLSKEREAFLYPIDQLPFPLAKNSDELVDNISSFNMDKYLESLDIYHKKYGRYNYKGNATEKVVEFILSR